MTYLIAKYTLLFLIAAVISYLLGRWSVSRKFVDVTDSHISLLDGAQGESENWSKLWHRFDELPEPRQPDMGRLMSRLDAVSYAIGKIPAHEPADLSRLEAGLADLGERIDNLPDPQPALDVEPMQRGLERLSGEVSALTGSTARDPVDLSSVEKRLDQLSVAVGALSKPDLEPVVSRLDGVAAAVADIPVAEIPVPTDLTPLTVRLEQIEAVVKGWSFSPTREVLAPIDESLASIRGDLEVLRGRQRIDMTPITADLNRVHARLDGLREPDLVPIRDHLALLEGEIKKLGAKLDRSTEKRSVTRRAPAPEVKFLKAPSHGRKDDLRKIVGVGPVLERLLNRNGVFYYWQIASWNKQDVSDIDEKLENFRGRIGRDKWISQARRLTREPDAAKAPG